jgi:predicted HicB family RNase H-like nuclease
MPRSLRIPPDLWEAAVEKAKAEGTTLTAVVIAALTRYVRREVK